MLAAINQLMCLQRKLQKTTKPGAMRHPVCTQKNNANYLDASSYKESEKIRSGLSEMCSRHVALNAQLVVDRLSTYDVPRDGNCLFRAASHAAFRHDDLHLSLRALTVDYIAQHEPVYCELFNLSLSDFADFLCDLKTPGLCAGEAAIHALSDVLHRTVNIHIAHSEPLPYSTAYSQATEPSTWLAFYNGLLDGPGHYKAIVPLNG